jgi:hypothetical protein
MSKEQQELVDEAYDRYCNTSSMYFPIWSQEQFINKCKTNTEFSEKCKLTIEERELTLEERHKLALPIWKEKYGPLANMMVPTNVDNTPYKIPTKLITTTYNDKTIENYE